MGLIQMLPNSKPTSYPSHMYFIILPIVSCDLVSIKIIIIIIIIIKWDGNAPNNTIT